MRLFVALDLPDLVVQQLSLVGGGIPGARWSPPQNLHITLRFIGEVDGGTKRQIEAALDRVDHEALSVQLGGVGHFPPRGVPRSLWAGVAPNPSLADLAAKIDRSLVTEVGLDPDPRNFAPHVTLARLRKAPQNRVVQFLQHHALLSPPPFVASAFWLYSSVLRRGGPTYRRERAFKLRPAPAG